MDSQIHVKSGFAIGVKLKTSVHKTSPLNHNLAINILVELLLVQSLVNAVLS